LLEEMLKHNRGLRLAALRTLPVALVVERKAETDAAKNSEAGVFKHGVEITLHGGYADLLAYLAQIEGLPQQMFWSRLHLKVDAYPKITLTLTVYTLSLDRTWLVV
jgi:MSHA biogenesis protein MshJ